MDSSGAGDAVFDDPGRWGETWDGRVKSSTEDGDIPARTGAGGGAIRFADSVGKCRVMEDTGWRFGIAGKMNHNYMIIEAAGERKRGYAVQIAVGGMPSKGF